MRSSFIRVVFICCLVMPLSSVVSQVTPNDGDWSEKYVVLNDTPEAELMVRTGDIDNLGFGWPVDFDPFTGESTPPHGYPWTADPGDPEGTDRIMVITSYNGTPPGPTDGYTSGTSRPENSVRPIALDYSLNGIAVRDAALQIFVDDFQAPPQRANYTVALNGSPFTEMEPVINSLNQTGPIGKVVTVVIPDRFLAAVQSGHLEIEFDDLTTGAGDGYAIDFVKLLINVRGFSQTGSISGRVVDDFTYAPIPWATVRFLDKIIPVDGEGNFLLTDVPAGLVYLSAEADGFVSAGEQFEVVSGQTTQEAILRLPFAPLDLNIQHAVELDFFGHRGATYILQYSADMETWTNEEEIIGEGERVIRFRRTRPAAYRYWRVLQP